MKEIFSRRSVRRFTPEQVSDQDLELLLRAAMRAPSAGNQQPWEFIVVKDKERMKQIQSFHIYSKPLDTAPCAVAVCGNTTRQRHKDFWIQDCSAAIQNLLLEAEHLGLGAVWMGVYPIEERVQGCKALFGLPETVITLGIVALGHPAEHPAPLDTYLPERVHFERWEDQQV